MPVRTDPVVKDRRNARTKEYEIDSPLETDVTLAQESTRSTPVRDRRNARTRQYESDSRSKTDVTHTQGRMRATPRTIMTCMHVCPYPEVRDRQNAWPASGTGSCPQPLATFKKEIKHANERTTATSYTSVTRYVFAVSDLAKRPRKYSWDSRNQSAMMHRIFMIECQSRGDDQISKHTTQHPFGFRAKAEL